jgi:hypothetical protein
MFNILHVTLHDMDITGETIDVLLGALGEQLASLRARLEIVVIGGSALTALGLVRRTTRDVDLLAIAAEGTLHRAVPCRAAPGTTADSKGTRRRDFGLDENWLNAGPTDLLKWGLPEGFMARVVTRPYGSALVVHFAGRVDQVHFKLFAMVDQGGGRHEADLRALKPTENELVAAAQWSLTQDPSPGYKMVLADALRFLGVDDADLGG